MPRSGIHVIQIAVISYVFCAVLLAQGTTGSIVGTAWDQSQAVLPGVTITATDRDTGQKRQAVSDDQGRFLMAQMKIGNYTLQAELPGFQTALRDVTLTLEGDAVVNFTLKVGAAATEVTVTSEAPLVETTSSSVRSLVDQQQIRDLPLNGRSFTDLTTLQTGVAVNYSGGSVQMGNEGTKISIAGSRVTQTLFQLDGTDIRNFRGVTPGSLAGVLLGVDTVQEFSVITNVANAEYGNFVGGVVNAITKSGSNRFHGTLFEFLRNSALDARNFFDRNTSNPLQRSSPPPFKRNQYGFTVGGPVKKDKLFFFGSYEGLNDRLTTTQIASVPSLDARRGFIPAQGQFTVSPVTKPILDTFPLPNSTVRADGTADYVYPARRATDEEYLVGKLDWQVSDKDVISGRYTFDNAHREQPFNIDVINEDARSRNQYLLVEWKRIVSSKVINEARVSFNRTFNGNDPVYTVDLPPVMFFNPNSFDFKGKPFFGIIITPTISQLGFSTTFMQQHVQNRFEYIDNLTYSTGAHSLKTGVKIQRFQFNNSLPVFMPGQYTFVGLRDLITAATPRSFTGTTTGNVPTGMRQILMGFYGQDDWRLRPNLTLNIGLRYEPVTLPVEVAGRLGGVRHPSDTFITLGNPLFTVNPSFKNFAPRVGFAWDPFGRGKTSVRGSFGVFYDLINPNFYYSVVHQNPPYAITVTQSNAPFPNFIRDIVNSGRNLVVQEGNKLTVPGLAVAPFAFSDGIEQARSHQYQLSMQQELLSSLVVQVSYMGSRGYNLPHILDRNQALPQTDARGVFPFFPAGAPRRNSAFGRLRDYAWDASSFYNALGITLKKRFSRGYHLQVSYTFGRLVDDASSTSTAEDAGGLPNGLSMFGDNIKFDRSLSVLDVRNRLSINGSWDLPFGSGRAIGSSWSGVTGQILGGWSLNGILTASNGNWTSLLLPFNWSRSGQAQDISDRPSLIPGGNNNAVLADGRDPNKYFDQAQFILGPPGYFGNLARNTLERPGVLTVDASIQKNFKLGEERYLQFRGEMFNIANRANFGTPDTSTILDETGRRSLTAGRITLTNTSSRQIQFGLKFYF